MTQITNQDFANAYAAYHYRHNLASVAKLKNTILGNGNVEQMGTLHHPIHGGWGVALPTGGIEQMKKEFWFPQDALKEKQDISTPHKLEEVIWKLMEGDGVFLAEPESGFGYKVKEVIADRRIVNAWPQTMYSSRVPNDLKIFDYDGEITRDDLGTKSQNAIRIGILIPGAQVSVISQTAKGSLGIGDYNLFSADGLISTVTFSGTKKRPVATLREYVNGPKNAPLETSYRSGMNVVSPNYKPVVATPYQTTQIAA